MCHGQRQPCAAADTRGGATPGLGLVWVAVKELKLSYHNGYIGIMEKNMETTIMGLYRVQGLEFKLP